MSQKDLTQFLETVRQDPSLQEKLGQPGADPVALATEAGYSVSLEEWREHFSRISDEDLEKVAGGNWGASMTNLQTQPGWCPQQN